MGQVSNGEHACESPPPPAVVWVLVTEDDTGVRVAVESTPHATEFPMGMAGRWVAYVPRVEADP